MSLTMEAPVVISRRTQLANLFTPAWSVPRNDAVDGEYQPRPVRRRFQMKKFTLLSIKQVKSHESTAESIQPAEITVEDPAVASTSPDEVLPKADGVVQSATRQTKPHTMNHERASNGIAGNAETTQFSDGVLQTLRAPKRRLWARSKGSKGRIVPKIDNAKMIHGPDPVPSSEPEQILTADLALSIYPEPVIASDGNSTIVEHQLQGSVVTPGREAKLDNGQDGTKTSTALANPSQILQDKIAIPDVTTIADTSQSTATIEFHITSVELYCPEKGLYVREIGGLSLSADIEREWRELVQPKLMINLQTALTSLPKQLSRAEKSTLR